MWAANEEITNEVPDPYDETVIGSRRYELTNHLGNACPPKLQRRWVLTVVTDMKFFNGEYWEAEVINVRDYYPFGMLMPERSYTVDASYRYGFNGKENDNDVKGVEGSQQDYGMRIYDPRLGRFLSVDPLTKSYPWFSPYQFAGNTPIVAIDLDGLENLDFRVVFDNKSRTLVLVKPTEEELRQLSETERTEAFHYAGHGIGNGEAEKALNLTGLPLFSLYLSIEMFIPSACNSGSNFAEILKVPNVVILATDEQVSIFIENNKGSQFIRRLPGAQEESENIYYMGTYAKRDLICRVEGNQQVTFKNVSKMISLTQIQLLNISDNSKNNIIVDQASTYEAFQGREVAWLSNYNDPNATASERQNIIDQAKNILLARDKEHGVEKAEAANKGIWINVETKSRYPIPNNVIEQKEKPVISINGNTGIQTW